MVTGAVSAGRWRPRLVRNRCGKLFVTFTPAISPRSAKKIRQQVRSWRLHFRVSQSLDDLADRVNPIIREWINYYGAYQQSSMVLVLRHINRCLIWRRSRILAVAIVLALAGAPVLAQAPDYDAIADNLVNGSLAVQPGETVVIGGGPSEIDLMAAIQVAVSKAGGQPVLTLNIPEANRRAVMETPIAHLEQLPTAGLLLSKITDVFINVGSIEDPDLFADVPEERLAASRQAGVPLARAFNNMNFRSASLGQTGGIPTVAYAKSEGADPEEVQTIFWRAVAVSPDDLTPKATQVASRMTNGAEVRVTSEAGTDLTFKIDRFPARINAGRTADVKPASGPTNVWLPAGEAYGCVDAASANGKLVVPTTTFRGVKVKNLRLTFKNGRVSKMSADSNGEMLEKYFDASSPKLKELSLVDLGLNPQSRIPAGSSYYSWEMGGMVTLGLGNNSWAGGDNDSDAALSLHLPGTTLSIGGETVVKGGELVK